MMMMMMMMIMMMNEGALVEQELHFRHEVAPQMRRQTLKRLSSRASRTVTPCLTQQVACTQLLSFARSGPDAANLVGILATPSVEYVWQSAPGNAKDRVADSKSHVRKRSMG